MTEIKDEVFPKQIRLVADFITYATVGEKRVKMFGSSKSGLRYGAFPDGRSFNLEEVDEGDVNGLAQKITEIYKDGVVLSPTQQIGVICNYAHYKDIPAETALHAVNDTILAMGNVATEFQVRTQDNIKAALKVLE